MEKRCFFTIQRKKKNKTEELTQLLIKSQNEKLKNKNDFEKNKDEEVTLNTYNFLDKKKKTLILQ